jgi:hypothetical protein
MTLLAGGHWQEKQDRDDDGWADLAGYSRGVVRPRFYWDGGNGRTALLTGGIVYENRAGGTLPGAVLAATSEPVSRSIGHAPVRLRRQRADAAREPLRRDIAVFHIRSAARASVRRVARAGPSRASVRRGLHEGLGRTPHLGSRRGGRTGRVPPARRSPLCLHVRHAGCVRAGRYQRRSLALSIGKRARRLSQPVRHVSEPACFGAVSMGRLDQPPVRGARLLCAHAAHRRDRSRRTDATGGPRAAQSRTRKKRFD